MPPSTHELDAPPWRRVESTLMATARTIRQAYEARLSPLGLNMTQASLLGFLHESGSLTQTQLAERLGLGRAATGSVIDALERKHLLERQPDTHDRRVWLVVVTPTGREMAIPILEIDQELRRQLRAGISRTERQQLAELLLRLQSNLSTVLTDDQEPTVPRGRTPGPPVRVSRAGGRDTG